MFPTASDIGSILTIDIGIMMGLLVIARMLDPKRMSDRLLFGAVTAGLLMIYALWRWHDTLPPISLSLQSLWPRLFISFESIAIAYTLISIVILSRYMDRSGQAERAQQSLAREDAYPAVDVFICTYDEPIEVVERSILSALALQYPNFTVWVLDDTRRDWLRDYCSRVGAIHLTRPDNKHAKAGNLNNGLAATAHRTNAPVILVLDADFAPRADFLTRTVGLLMLEPDCAIVQTPFCLLATASEMLASGIETSRGKVSWGMPRLPASVNRVWWMWKLWFSVESGTTSQVSRTGVCPGPSGRQIVVCEGSNCSSRSGAGFCDPGTTLPCPSTSS